MKNFLLVFLMFFSAMMVMAQTTYNWVPQTISPDNNLQKMVTIDDTDTLLVVGNNNSVFRSIDDGKTWDFLKVVDAVFDFPSMSINSSGTGLLSSRRQKIIDYSGITDPYVSGKLLKTTDYGATWTIADISGITSTNPDLDPYKEGCYGLDIYTVGSVDASNAFMYVGWYDVSSGDKVSRGAVFETNDGGTAWTPVSDDLGSSFITAIQTKGTTTYFAGNSILFKKSGGTVTDLYSTLVTAEGGDETIYIYDLDVISETEFYIVTTSNGLFHSTDGGATITELTGTGVPSGGNDIKVIDANTIMVLGTSSKSKVTVDGGATWNSCYPGTSCWEIAGVFNDSVYALKDVIYKIAVSDLSTNPTNWISQTITNSGENLQQMHIIDESNAIIAGFGEEMKKTSDKGISWTDVSLPELYDQTAEEQEYEVDFNGACYSEGISYAAARRFALESYSSVLTYYPGPIFKTTDNWETWELLDIDEIGKENESDVSIYPFHDDCYGFDPYSIGCITDSIVFIWANWYDTVAGYADKVNHSRVFRSKDGGETWKSVTDDLGGSFITTLYFADENNGFIAGNKVLLKTTDCGETFTDLYPTLDPTEEAGMYFKGITYVSDDEIYFPTTNDSIWLTTDGGTTFTDLPGQTGTTDLIKLADDHILILGSSSKSFLTKDGAETWEACSPGVSVWSIGGIVNDSVYALTKGDIYKIAFSELVDDTPNGIDDMIIDDGSIKFLNRYSEVEIVSDDKSIETYAVYNIIGQLIEVKHPNSTSCVIDKSSYTPGIYIISVFTKDKRSTRKVVF